MSNLSKIFIFCSCFIFSLVSISAKNIEISKTNLKANVTKTKTKIKPILSKSLAPIALQTRVNLNRASAKKIAKSFKGFGKVRSLAIVKYREEHGVFKNINDLSSVRGISKRFVDKYAERLKLTFAL